MTKPFLFFVLLLSVQFISAQNVIQYGKYNVSKDEFLRAFNKNKTQNSEKEKAVKDYVELYANFKLKVQAALEMRIDTSYQQQMDYENFRKQIEGNYLNDEATVKKMQDEALLRSQTDLHLELYSVPFTKETPADDTLKRYQSLQKLKNDFVSNNNPMVGEGITQKDMGFINVFTLPYVYENMAYNLSIGETSPIIRNKKGWHFFRLTEKRKAMGKWRVAQILLCFPPDADQYTRGKIQSRADSIYKLLQSGSEFSAMARIFSEDRLTANSGGELSEFSTGKYDPVFMHEISSLQKDGDLSKPFFTNHGYHIIKRIGYTPLPDSLSDEMLQYEIKQKLMQDKRLLASREAFAKEVMKKIGYKAVKGLNMNDLFRYADAAFEHADNETYPDSLPISNKTVVQFAKGSKKGNDWLRYARDTKSNPEIYKGETTEQLWNNYQSYASMEYYRANLENYNTDFAFQIKEFKEGNMLFEVMDKKVWSQASNDSVGLRNYFNTHRDKYTWNESVDVLVFNCNSELAALEVQNKLESGLFWRRVLEMKQDEVQGDSSRFELNQIGISAVSGKMSGKFSDIIVNQDGTASFMKYLDFHSKDEPRSFEEAKGLVINDYQAVLEKNWLDELKKKYPIKINNAVVQEIIKQIN